MSKELNEMTVRDVLELKEYQRQMGQVMVGEVFNQNRAAQEAKKQGARLARTPLDNLRDKGVWTADKMVDLYGSVLNKTLLGFGATERAYIQLVGFEAFRRTLDKLKAEQKTE